MTHGAKYASLASSVKDPVRTLVTNLPIARFVTRGGGCSGTSWPSHAGAAISVAG